MSPSLLVWQQMVSFLNVANGKKNHLIELTFGINLIKQKSTACCLLENSVRIFASAGNFKTSLL